MPIRCHNIFYADNSETRRNRARTTLASVVSNITDVEELAALRRNWPAAGRKKKYAELDFAKHIRRSKFAEPDFAKCAKLIHRTGSSNYKFLGSPRRSSIARSRARPVHRRRCTVAAWRSDGSAVCPTRSALIIRELSLDLCELIHFGAASSDFQRETAREVNHTARSPKYVNKRPSP